MDRLGAAEMDCAVRIDGSCVEDPLKLPADWDD